MGAIINYARLVSAPVWCVYCTGKRGHNEQVIHNERACFSGKLSCKLNLTQCLMQPVANTCFDSSRANETLGSS